jgi:uncharacterized delta-60 repeat protein
VGLLDSIESVKHGRDGRSARPRAASHRGIFVMRSPIQIRPRRGCAAASALLLLALSTAHADTALDAFDPGTSGGVSAVLALSDGKVLLGGTFATVGGAAQRNLARVRANGARDTAFTNDADGTVVAMVRQPDGKVLVGGFFTAIGGVPRDRIARLAADGSLDTTFDPGATGGSSTAVLGIALQADGKILIVGQFTQVDGAPHNGAARLNADGSVDASFAANVGESVSAVLPMPDGSVIIGGGFTHVDGHGHSHLARLNADGSVDGSFTAFLDASVRAIARLPDGSLIVSGSFVVPQISVARFEADGTPDNDFNLHFASAGVSAIAMQPDGKVLFGGLFNFVNSVPRQNLVRFNSDFTLDESFDIAIGSGGISPVASIAVPANGIVVIGGDFTSAGGEPRGHGARLKDDEVFGAGFD